jgi:dTMP kinase
VLIAFEGGEGTGKSTQARLLAERLGDGALLTYQPGATTLGASIRAVVLDPATVGLDARAEALLYAADRAQHVAEVVRPALDAGRVVITDRYVHSSVAYQGIGRGLGAEAVASVSAFATDDLLPDVVVLLVVPPATREARLAARGERDRLESAGEDFNRLVEAGFLDLAAADPARWVVVDGDAPIDDVAARVWDRLEAHLPTR